MMTIDLDRDAYELVEAAIAKGLAREVATAAGEETLRALGTARRVGGKYRVAGDRALADSLREWFEKTVAIVDALGDRVPEGPRIIDCAGRGLKSIDTATYRQA
jgi:hypothetical protein